MLADFMHKPQPVARGPAGSVFSKFNEFLDEGALAAAATIPYVGSMAAAAVLRYPVPVDVAVAVSNVVRRLPLYTAEPADVYSY